MRIGGKRDKEKEIDKFNRGKKRSHRQAERNQFEIGNSLGDIYRRVTIL